MPDSTVDPRSILRLTTSRLALLAVVALSAGPVLAQQVEPCARACHDDLRCERNVLGCLTRRGQSRQAVQRLKALPESLRESPVGSQLLAQAYLADGNAFWAERVLRSALERDPEDCASRVHLAWVLTSQGDVDLATETLHTAHCPGSGAERARWLLTRSFVASTDGDDAQALQLLDQARAASAVFPEDNDLTATLRSRLDPGWLPPLTTHLQLSAGATSDAKAGSPTDPGSSGPASPLLRIDHHLRLVVPLSRFARPTFELAAKGHGALAEDVVRLSYLELAARPGLLLGSRFPRLLLAYKTELLLLGDAQRRLFYEAHRAELEVETEDSLLVFLGLGRRVFREGGRSRNELDGGVGWSGSPWQSVQLLGAIAARAQDAVGDAYDLAGATALGVVRAQLWGGLTTRAGQTLGVDYYLASGGERGRVAHGADGKRLDLTSRTSLGLWSPPLQRARVGLTYEIGLRDSSADGRYRFDYIEHRLLLSVRLGWTADPWAPPVVDPDSHVPIAYGIAGSGDGELESERIQDLLRQDEAARRGSSCVD